MVPVKTIVVDGHQAQVRPVSWRLFRKLATVETNAEQLDLMEEVVVACSKVEGIEQGNLLDELSRPAVEALFAAAVHAEDDADPLGKKPSGSDSAPTA